MTEDTKRPFSLLDMPLTPREEQQRPQGMKVLAIASAKGGTGKTTLAASLAVAASLQDGQEVVIIDTDPLGALNDWWVSRRDNGLRLVHATLDRLAEDLAALEAAGISLVIIDTPTGDARALDAILAQADLALVPCRPGPHDLRALAPMMARLEGQGVPSVLVLNEAEADHPLTADMREAMARHGQLAPRPVTRDTTHVTAMIGGRTAQEQAPGSPASEDILALWQHIETRLERLPEDAGKRSPKTSNTSLARQAMANPDAPTPGHRLPPRPRHTPPPAPRINRTARNRTCTTLPPTLAAEMVAAEMVKDSFGKA